MLLLSQLPLRDFSQEKPALYPTWGVPLLLYTHRGMLEKRNLLRHSHGRNMREDTYSFNNGWMDGWMGKRKDGREKNQYVNKLINK